MKSHNKNGRLQKSGLDGFWGNIFNKGNVRQDEVFAVLAKSPIFSDMTKAEVLEFRRIVRVRSFKSQEPVFWEGEPGIGMYFVKSGSLGVYKIKGREKKKELAVLKRGNFVGELALFDESPRTATCIAKEDAQVIGLFRPDLFALLARKPRLGNKFLFQLAVVLGERLKITTQELDRLKEKLDRSNILL